MNVVSNFIRSPQQFHLNSTHTVLPLIPLTVSYRICRNTCDRHVTYRNSPCYVPLLQEGYAVVRLVEALRYKLDGSIPDSVIRVFY
jgi:hypothetical protein